VKETTMTDAAADSLSIVLSDVDPGHSGSLPIRIVGNGSSISIFPDGYGDYGSAEAHGCPVFLELHQGRLRVVVFADINREDPTQVIDLETARGSARQDTEPSVREERTNAQV
jgi:hypothetical protein